MAETNHLLNDIARLNAVERQIIERFIHRQRAAAPSEEKLSLGDRVADRIAALGGSWRFIFVTIGAIVGWIAVNQAMGRAFDPYPYILLNLMLGCVAALQAPFIMMSQNRQTAHDRLNAQHDYEVNTKAELEIVGLHAKIDEIRDVRWMELMRAQEQQIALLTQLVMNQGADVAEGERR